MSTGAHPWSQGRVATVTVVCTLAGAGLLAMVGWVGWRAVQDSRVDAQHERQLLAACDNLWVITAAREPQEIAESTHVVLDMFAAGTYLYPESGTDLARLRNPVQELEDLYLWTDASEWTAADTERAYTLAETAQFEASQARQYYCPS